MGKKTDIVKLLKSKENEGWYRRAPADQLEIIDLEKEIQQILPDDYKYFLLYSDGGDIEGVSSPSIFYDVKMMINEYDDYNWSKEMTSCLAFGDDGGDFLYFFDMVNGLGFGAFSVFMCEMGSLQRIDTVFISKSFSGMIAQVFSGENFLKRKPII